LAARRTSRLQIIPNHGADCPDRRRVERFIEEHYHRQFGAVIASHYPTLMSLHAPDGRILAALGLRLAADNRLFLEQYLEQPIDHLVSAAIGETVDRSEIIEIGNLASRSRHATVRLIIAAARHLDTHRYLYAAVTATERLRCIFDSFCFSWTLLGPARAECLPDGGHTWGRYYRHDPQVIVGATGPAVARMRQHLLPSETQE
jgi:Thermostable hemolysin